MQGLLSLLGSNGHAEPELDYKITGSERFKRVLIVASLCLLRTTWHSLAHGGSNQEVYL